MKKMINVLALTLAMNFLAVAGFVVWLHQTHRLDRQKVHAIRDLLFPKGTTDAPATQPAAEPATQPASALEELLAKSSGRSATEQVQFIQKAFDAQTVLIERRERELLDLQRQVDLARQQLARDRAELDSDRAALAAQQDEQTRLAGDQGFQDSLALYNTMPSKQVKQIFMTLPDATVVNYLQAMPPRSAARIIKEFKTPEEVGRVQSIMERMRHSAPPSEAAQSPPQDAQAQAKE